MAPRGVAGPSTLHSGFRRRATAAVRSFEMPNTTTTRMSHPYAALFPQLLDRAKQILESVPACHDWDHTLRVLANARHLADAEGADAAVVAFAAVLHDIGRPEELADNGKTCHAQLGEERTRDVLRELGVSDSAFVEQVAHCVRAHRYRRRRDSEPPATLEARVVFDADKLDCIGAVGIGRSFHFAGRTGARLHNTESEATGSESYSREDTAYREFLVKLRGIHERMLTAEGRRIASARHQFMVAFFGRLCREVKGDDF